MKIENVEVYNLKRAIYAARNSFESWAESDSTYALTQDAAAIIDSLAKPHQLSEKDLRLAKNLVRRGASHRKFLRQIFVVMDVTAPLTWWKQCDQYKVGTVTNSTSTMHCLGKRDLTLEDFATYNMSESGIEHLQLVIDVINHRAAHWRATKDSKAWQDIINLLPGSFLQLRTLSLNYEVAYNIVKQRRGHRLDEWKEMVKALLDLPHMRDFVEGDSRIDLQVV